MSAVLSTTEIEAALADLPGWAIRDDAIEKTFTFRSFREAVSFIVRLSFEAEDQDHHPELNNVYSRVTVRLRTHDAGDKVTARDVKLATAIERFNWV